MRVHACTYISRRFYIIYIIDYNQIIKLTNLDYYSKTWWKFSSYIAFHLRDRSCETPYSCSCKREKCISDVNISCSLICAKIIKIK